jgi:glycine reductase
MCKEIQSVLGIPVISAMNEYVPGVEMYRKDFFITKTPDNSRDMMKCLNDMVQLMKEIDKSGGESKLLSLELIPDPEEFNYFRRDILRNAWTEKTMAERAVEKLLAKVKGEAFETEVVPMVVEDIPAPPPIKDLSKASIAVASDGGIVLQGNPDKMATRSNIIWGTYSLEELLEKGNFEIVHAGYFNDYVLDDPNRMIPYDILKELESNGTIGKLEDTYYSMPACTTITEKCKENGAQIAEKMIADGKVDGVVLTST